MRSAKRPSLVLCHWSFAAATKQAGERGTGDSPKKGVRNLFSTSAVVSRVYAIPQKRFLEPFFFGYRLCCVARDGGRRGIGGQGPKQDADQFYHAHGEAVLSGCKASIVAAKSGADKRRKCV